MLPHQMSMGNNLKTVQAASAITGNTTMGSAYNFGTWSSINDTAILYSGEQQSWFRFTVAAGEKIYVRVSSDTAYPYLKQSQTFQLYVILF